MYTLRQQKQYQNVRDPPTAGKGAAWVAPLAAPWVAAKAAPQGAPQAGPVLHLQPAFGWTMAAPPPRLAS